jgi:hypothetical protein
MSEVMIIRSSEWMRAEYRAPGTEWDYREVPYSARLLSEDGKMCCLGIRAKMVGLGNAHICGMGTPLDTYDMKPSPVTEALNKYWQEWLHEGEVDDEEFLRMEMSHNKRAKEAMTINDATGTIDDQKIELLRPIFAEIGVTLDWRPNE